MENLNSPLESEYFLRYHDYFLFYPLTLLGCLTNVQRFKFPKERFYDENCN